MAGQWCCVCCHFRASKVNLERQESLGSEDSQWVNHQLTDLMTGAGGAKCCDWFSSASLLIQGFKGHRGEPGAPGPKVSVLLCLFHVFEQVSLHLRSTTVSFVSETQTAIIYSSYVYGIFILNCRKKYKTEEHKTIYTDGLIYSTAITGTIQEFTQCYSATFIFWHGALWCQDMSCTFYTHLLRENRCTCCFVSHTAHTLKERFSATWPIAWLITDSSDWATVKQTASQPCSATPTADNLLEELWSVSIDTLRILLHCF